MDPPADSIDTQDARDETAAPLPVLYCDERLAVVDKPAGLMVHDSALARGEREFAADRLREQFARPIFLVHRLDRATSGCLLLAFDREAASLLGRSLMAGEIDKAYLAVCRGWPEPAEGVIDHPLDGGPGKPQKKPAITRYQRLASAELPFPDARHPSSRYALLRCWPQTGRFRQIRRHLKHLSHHLVGDSSHGDGRHNRFFRGQGIHRMLLHAESLRFPHPEHGAMMLVRAGGDTQWLRAMQLLGWDTAKPEGASG